MGVCGNKRNARLVQTVLTKGLNYILQGTGNFSVCTSSMHLELDSPPVYPILVGRRLRSMWKSRWLSGTLCDLVESRLYWWSSKNTYLKTSERLAQEVLMTVGRGIVNDDLACNKKVPEKWLSEKSKLHMEMAFDLWGEPQSGNSSSSVARDLIREAIPRLWIHQLEECEAQFLKDYLGGGRAINGRYLDIWFRHPELARGCQILLEMR